MPTYSKGIKAAEAASKASSAGRADWLNVKSGADPIVLRPVSDLDDILTIDRHMGVPTKPHPKNVKEEKWPSHMSAVCRNSVAFRVHDAEGNPTDEYEEDYGDCYIHLNMQDVMGKFKKSVAVPVTQSFGLFVMREAVRDGGGKITGIRDVIEEFKDEAGTVHRIPKIVVASQSYSNFWGHFAAAAYMTDTITDRDFAVAREDNDYTVTPLPDRGPALSPGTPAWQRYVDAMALKDLSVEKIVTDQSSHEYYGRWFDPAWHDPREDEETAGDEDTADTAGQPTLSDEEAEKMRKEMAQAFSGSGTTTT